MESVLNQISFKELNIDLHNGNLEAEYPGKFLPAKFRAKSGKAKSSSYEEIDENLYEESAKVVCFHTSEDRLFYWIKACHIFYYDNLSKIEGVEVKWVDNPKEWEDPNGGNSNFSIVIELHDMKQDCLLYNVTIFISTGTIRVQGHHYRTFSRCHFPILKDLISLIECGEEETLVKEYRPCGPPPSTEREVISVECLKVLQSSLIDSIGKLEISFRNHASSVMEGISSIKSSNASDSFQRENIVMKSQLQQEKESCVLMHRQHEEASKHLKQMLTDARNEVSRANSEIEYMSNKLSKQKEEMEALEVTNRELKQKLSDVQDELLNIKSGILAQSRGEYEMVSASSSGNRIQSPTVLLVGTSNIKNINEKFLSSAFTTKKSIAYTTEDATKYIDGTTDSAAYDAVLLHILTNDVKNVDPAECVTKLQKLITVIKKKWPTTKLIISLTTPRNDGFQIKCQLVNAMLKQHLLLLKDENVSFIDHHNMYDTNDGGPNLSILAEDGYHLNDRGVSKLAVSFRNTIHATLNVQIPANRRHSRSRSRYGNRSPGSQRGRGRGAIRK